MKKRIAKLSHRFSGIAESKTVALTGLVQTLRRQGRDVITLGAGEPNFDTPDHIKNAAKHINADITKILIFIENNNYWAKIFLSKNNINKNTF